MKIGIDISQIVYQGTGVATYTRNLVKSLMEIDNKNEYILFGSTLRRQKQLNDFFLKLGKKNCEKKFYAFPPKILELIWNKIHASHIESFIGNIDIFHTSDWTEPPARCKKITTVHDLLVYKYPEYLNKRIIDNQIRKLAWVKKESNLIIADSKSTKQDLIEYLKIPENKIKVIYLGVEPIFSPQSKKKTDIVKDKYQINKEYLLCVGTREPRKNLSNIIAAFKSLNKKELLLVIVGNVGWGRDIKESKNIKILDFVPKADLPCIYSGAKVFVYPSLYEGFGLPILEAMACGTPVITSNKGSLAEIAGPSIIVDPADSEKIAQKISEIIRLSDAERKKLVNLGIKHTAGFTWEKTAKETLEVYEKAISDKQ